MPNISRDLSGIKCERWRQIYKIAAGLDLNFQKMGKEYHTKKKKRIFALFAKEHETCWRRTLKCINECILEKKYPFGIVKTQSLIATIMTAKP